MACPTLTASPGGWIDYSHNHTLVELFSRALVSSATGHTAALDRIQEDIALLKRQSEL